jgi:hypothetical protein
MSNTNTEKYISHIDDIDYNKIKSIINNNMEDTENVLSINLYTCTKKNNGKTNKPKKKRCKVCNKKVGLLGFECKCGHTFCSIHRMPEDHECCVDFKSEGKDKLRHDNPIVIKDKIDNRI